MAIRRAASLSGDVNESDLELGLGAENFISLPVKVSTGKTIIPSLRKKRNELKPNDVFLFADRKQAAASVSSLVHMAIYVKPDKMSSQPHSIKGGKKGVYTSTAAIRTTREVQKHKRQSS